MKLLQDGYYWIQQLHTVYHPQQHGKVTGTYWGDPEIALYHAPYSNRKYGTWVCVGDWDGMDDSERVYVMSDAIVIPVGTEIKANV